MHIRIIRACVIVRFPRCTLARERFMTNGELRAHDAGERGFFLHFLPVFFPGCSSSTPSSGRK
jgi:hypothetical protein